MGQPWLILPEEGYSHKNQLTIKKIVFFNISLTIWLAQPELNMDDVLWTPNKQKVRVASKILNLLVEANLISLTKLNVHSFTAV